MDVHVDVDSHLVLRDVPDSLLNELLQVFTIWNPIYRINQYLEISTSTQPERISCVEEFPDGSVRLPRGAWKDLRRECSFLGMSAVFHPKTSYGEKLELVFKEEESLRSYQQDAIGAMVMGKNGYVTIPCGGGKTWVGLAFIARIGRSALVIVPTIDLLDQWVADCAELLGFEPGILGGGKNSGLQSAQIVIAIDDSILSANKRGELDLTRFGVTLVDECHLAAAPTYRNILAACPGFCRIGLSAQTERDDGLTRLMQWGLGPQLFAVSYRELINLGHLLEPEVRVRYTGLTFESDPTIPEVKNLHALKRMIVSDKARNEQIAKAVVASASAEEPMVVLSNNKKHCELLHAMCAELGVKGIVLTSTSVSKKKRKKIMEDLNSGQEWLVFATSLFDTGVNIKRLAHVVMALPTPGIGKTQQKTGRVLRTMSGKKTPVVHEFVDARVPKLFDWWKSRSKSYRKEGFKMTGEIDA